MKIPQLLPRSKKYEVDVVGYCKAGYKSDGEDFREKQNDGWEIAGEIKVDGKFHSMTFLKIPMKRLLKPEYTNSEAHAVDFLFGMFYIQYTFKYYKYENKKIKRLYFIGIKRIKTEPNETN